MKAMAFGLLAVASANEANPIEKLAQMKADLQDTNVRRGWGRQKNYEEFSEWCEGRSKDLGFEIATEIRDKEAADFAVEEKELTTIIDMLHHAVAVLEEELGSASVMQAK